MTDIHMQNYREQHNSSSSLALSRREFVTSGAVALAGLLEPRSFSGQEREQPRKRKVLHIIGHSHLDAAWLWPWTHASDLAITTFRSVLERMKETPGFCYSHSSSAHYRWVEQTAPDIFREVQSRIHEGRWEVVGGWPVEPDCNIPSTESFVRHALYGKAYCKESLGVDVRIGFNPDSFGHAAGLPTILGGAGYDSYVFMRPVDADDLPLLFWWEGPDGSRVLTLRIYKNYSAGATSILSDIPNIFATGFDDGAFFLGVGDHGGGVTRQQIQQVLQMMKADGPVELRWSTLGNFFSAVRSSTAIKTLPVIRHDLQYVARGCYSSYGRGKVLNRRAQYALGQAEATLWIASQAAAHPYPMTQLRDAWWNVLFCQFHDMLAGSATKAVYEDVRDTVGAACNTAKEAQTKALEIMAKRVDTRRVPESCIFIFNPLPWARRALVEVSAERYPERGTDPITHLSDSTGESIPLQWAEGLSEEQFTASLELPACGYRVLQLDHGTPPTSGRIPSNLSASNTDLGLASLRAKDGTELLAGRIGLVVIDDPTDAWGHGDSQFYVSRWRREIGRPTLLSCNVVSDGPVTRVTRQVAEWKNSRIVLDIIEATGTDVVELRFTMNWCERGQLLKLEIPAALHDPRTYAKVPGAVVQRAATGEEEPYQDWIAIEGRAGKDAYTIGLLNDSSYSYDCLDGLLRTVVLRSVPFLPYRSGPQGQGSDNPTIAVMDQGWLQRRFWLVARRGGWENQCFDRLSSELQTSIQCVMDSAHPGHEGWEQSFLEVSPNTVEVLAIKHAERSEGAIVRVQNRSGQDTRATISSAARQFEFHVALKPFQIKTLLIRKNGQSKPILQEIPLTES